MSAGSGERRGNAPLRIGLVHASLESALATLLVPIVGTLAWPEDPLLLTAGFPYLIFSPLLPALRYGFAFGFGSALALTLALAMAWWLQILPVPQFPTETVFGMLTTCMIAGEFTNLWRRRADRAWAAAEYCQTRLNAFTPRYYTLKASHDRLEQKLAGSTQSLRTALQTVRDRFPPQRSRPPLDVVGSEILSIFANFCAVQVGCVFAVRDNAEVIWPPCATLGSGVQIPATHAFVSEALRTNQTVSAHFRTDQKSDLRERDQDVLAVVPIADAFHNVWALVVVQELPFMSFHQDNLVLMAVIGGAIGDELTSSLEQTGSEDAGEQEFRLHLRRCLDDRRDHGLAVSVVTFLLNPEFASSRVLDQITAQTRSLDLYWISANREGDTLLALLLPLTDELGAAGFLQRIEGHFRSRLGKSLAEAGVQAQSMTLGRQDTVDDVVTQIQGLRITDEAPILAPAVPAA
ncbi:MAG: PelD GGDEF domain-containing protein [Planctomycetota bacterium]